VTNLRLYGGRVPVPTGHPDSPILLVDFPDRGSFAALYGHRVSANSLDRYFDMLQARARGATLIEAGKIGGGLTRERVRQIEATFLRLMQKQAASKQQSR